LANEFVREIYLDAHALTLSYDDVQMQYRAAICNCRDVCCLSASCLEHVKDVSARRT
jgi:hypothetical protein